MKLLKTGFVGSSWKGWFHNEDHTQNLKMPENFTSCNYKKNQKQTYHSVALLSLAFRGWMEIQKRQFLKSLLSRKPWLRPSTELLEPWPSEAGSRYHCPVSTNQLLILQIQEFFSLFSKYPPPFFLSFLAVIQPLSFTWKKQDTKWVESSSVGKIIMKMRFGSKFEVSSAISLSLSSSKCYPCFKVQVRFHLSQEASPSAFCRASNVSPTWLP